MINRSISFFFIVSILLLVSCNSGKNYKKLSKEELNELQQELVIKKTHAIANALLDYYFKANETPPIYVWADIKNYLDYDSTVIGFRQKFNDGSEKLDDYQMSIEPWQDLMERVEAVNNVWDGELAEIRNGIIDSLRKHDETYNNLVKSMQIDLKEGNFKVMSYVINDYINQGRAIPVDWIEGHVFGELLVNPKVLKIDDEIVRVKQAILEKQY